MVTSTKILDLFSLKRYCQLYRVGIWQCPPFIFMIMGAIIVGAILTTYFVGQNYAEPAVVALVVIGVTLILFVLSYIVLNSFERVAQTAKEKSEFIGIMSHQLRSPLSAIKWQLDLLLRGDLDINVESEAYQAILATEEQNERMIRLVNDLLEINRFEGGNMIFKPESFLLGSLVGDVTARNTHRAKFLNIDIVFFPPENDMKVSADQMKIAYIIETILDNAIRYSSSGGKVIVALDKVSQYARCSITDEGMGISEKDAKKIFIKFFRGEGSKKYQTEGMGIGLYLAKIIIESSGGKIGFSGIEGKGSTFWFSLPIVE